MGVAWLSCGNMDGSARTRHAGRPIAALGEDREGTRSPGFAVVKQGRDERRQERLLEIDSSHKRKANGGRRSQRLGA